MASYYHSIRARASAAHPTLVTDESLFQALLLALVAGRKSIVVRTPEKAKLLTHIVNILYLLFGLSVVKLQLRQHEKLSPDEFLRLLFLENTIHGQITTRTSSRKTLNAGGSHAFAFRRSISYPIASVANGNEYDLHGLHANPDKLHPDAEHVGLSSARSCTLHERDNLSRVHTDPTPLCHDDKTEEGLESRLFPNVLVISGLEYTSEEVQKVLWTAMSEQQISIGRVLQSQRINQKPTLSEGIWHLPSDFFVVYVCPLGNGFDRPSVHKSLVDRFAMSIEAYPHVETLDSQMPPLSPIEIEPTSLRPVLSPLELADLRVLAGPTHTIIGSRADLYLSDLLSAVRNHPHLDGMLITARCRAETMQLLRTWRALFGPPPEDDGHVLPTLDVTDEDVRNVFVGSVQHRVKVLDGPRDEVLASLVFTAVRDSGDEEWEMGRRTVKEILQEILDEV